VRAPDAQVIEEALRLHHEVLPADGLDATARLAALAPVERDARVMLREVVERLRPDLRTFRDDAGRELFDVPDAPLPDPDQPAPPRFLPEYDNALLSHADRTRIVPKGRKVPLPPGNGAAIGTFLVDGFLRGTWRVERSRGAAALVIAPDRALPPADRAAVEAEGDALLQFVAADATDRAVRFAPVP